MILLSNRKKLAGYKENKHATGSKQIPYLKLLKFYKLIRKKVVDKIKESFIMLNK